MENPAHSSISSGPSPADETSSVPRLIPCPVAIQQMCRMTFSDLASAGEHTNTAHGFKRRLYPCPFAGRSFCHEPSFLSLEGAIQHGSQCRSLLSFSPKGPNDSENLIQYKCPWFPCGQMFLNLSLANSHWQDHITIRWMDTSPTQAGKDGLNCPLASCQQTLCSLPNLKRHLRVHTGEKIHSCHICHRGFSGAHWARKHAMHGICQAVVLPAATAEPSRKRKRSNSPSATIEPWHTGSRELWDELVRDARRLPPGP